MSMEVTQTQLDGEVVTVGQAAQIAQLSRDTIRRYADAGKLRSVRTPGGQRRFLRTDVEALRPTFGAAA